jgi:hypothetical protein
LAFVLLLSFLDFSALFLVVFFSFLGIFLEDCFADFFSVPSLLLEDDVFTAWEDCLDVLRESFDDAAFLVFVLPVLAFLPPLTRQ